MYKMFVALFFFYSLNLQAAGERILYQEEVECPQTPEIVNNLLDDIISIQEQFKNNLKCEEINVRFDKLTSILNGTMIQEGGLATIRIKIEAHLVDIRGGSLEISYINEKVSKIIELIKNSQLTQDNLDQVMSEVRVMFLDIPLEDEYFYVVHGIRSILLEHIDSNPSEAVPARQDFLSLIFDNENTTLSVDDAKKIQSYTSAVTEEAGVLISMIADAAQNGSGFLNRNECQISPEDEWAATERVTGVLYEAASFISQVAGPYGVPIQVGASIFKGAVGGFLAYKERNKNIAFDEGEDGGLSTRRFYENAVCLLEKTNAEAQTILNPKRHLDQLLHVRSRVVQEFQKSVPDNCLWCRQMASSLSKRAPVKALNQVMASRQKLGLALSSLEEVVLNLAQGEAVNLAWLNEEIEKFRALANSNANGTGAADALANLEAVKDFLYDTATDNFFEYYKSRARVSGRELDRQIYDLERVFQAELDLIGEEITDDGEFLPEGYEDYVLQRYGIDPNLVSDDDINNYGVRPNYKALVYGEASMFESAYPSLYSLYFISSKARLLTSYSSYALSETLDSIRKWQEKALNLRVIHEYCEFFESVYKLKRSTYNNTCDSIKFKESWLETSYQAFLFADLLGVDHRLQLEESDGPVDFNLMDRFEIIKELRLEAKNPTVFIDLALDFEALIEDDKEFRIYDENHIDFLPERGEVSYRDWHKAAVDSFTQRLQSTPLAKPFEN